MADSTEKRAVNPIVRDVRNAQRVRLGLPEVEHDGREDIDAFIAAGGTVSGEKRVWRPWFVQKAMDHPEEYGTTGCDCFGLEQHIPLAQVRSYVEQLEASQGGTDG